MIHNHWEWQLSHACMYVCMYACMYAYVYVYIYIHIFKHHELLIKGLLIKAVSAHLQNTWKIQWLSETRSFILFFISTNNKPLTHSITPVEGIWSRKAWQCTICCIPHGLKTFKEMQTKTQNSQTNAETFKQESTNSHKNEKNIVSSPLQGKFNRSSLFSFNFNQEEIGWKWMKMNNIPEVNQYPFHEIPLPPRRHMYITVRVTVHTLDNRRTCKQPSLQNNSEFVTTCK